MNTNVRMLLPSIWSSLSMPVVSPVPTPTPPKLGEVSSHPLTPLVAADDADPFPGVT